MLIGVPKEIKKGEQRVAVTPAGPQGLSIAWGEVAQPAAETFGMEVTPLEELDPPERQE